MTKNIKGHLFQSPKKWTRLPDTIENKIRNLIVLWLKKFWKIFINEILLNDL